MKSLVVVGALLAALVLAACGSDGDPAAQAGNSAPKPPPEPMLAMSKAEIAQLPEYNIKAYKDPVPKKLVIKDLWKGTGVVIKPHDRILVNFAGAHYGEAVHTTPATRNIPTEFSLDEVVQTWKEGLPGMRVGGRRELIAPHSIDYENGTYIYVIDLLAIERR